MGYVETSPGIFERPLKKNERKDSPISDQPVQASAVIQEYKTVRKKRNAVHAKGNKRKDAGDHIKAQATVLLNFRLTDNRTHDLDGMGAAIFDALRHAGVIAEDSTRFVQRTVFRFEIAPVPGVDIVIIDYETI